MSYTKYIDMSKSEGQSMNRERYSDPTAETAIANVMREQKKKKRLRSAAKEDVALVQPSFLEKNENGDSI